MVKMVPKYPLLVSLSLLPLHLSHQPGGPRDEELHQQHPGEAANQHPVCIKPGQGDCGEEGDPDKDDVGQVKVTVILISLCHGVGDHPDDRKVSLIILIILHQTITSEYLWEQCRQNGRSGSAGETSVFSSPY